MHTSILQYVDQYVVQNTDRAASGPRKPAPRIEPRNGPEGRPRAEAPATHAPRPRVLAPAGWRVCVEGKV